MRPPPRLAAATLAVGAIVLQTAFGLAAPARADEWPSRTVTVVVPYAPGGFTDTLARIASKYLAEKLGQGFVVENRAGAGGGIGTTYVTKSPPDGYILLFGSASQPGIAPLTQKITYDPDALAHLLSTGFAHRAGFEVVNIPYKGSAPVAAAVMQGDVDMAWAGVSDIISFVPTGKVKVLAISSERRAPTLPDVPSVTETYPDFHLETWNGFFAPRGAPDEIADKISRLMRQAVASPEIGGRLRELGIEPIATTPAEMAAAIKTDKEFYARAVKAAGIKVE